MNLDEIDHALSEWKVRRQRIDDNLMAIETDPVCALLEAAKGGGLQGTTRETVEPALSAMRELFAQRALLDDVIVQATEMRSKVNRLWPGDSLTKIEHLLMGPSIPMPPVETPLAQRGLLDTAETASTISPPQLLEAMTHAFVQARDAIAAVTKAWDQLTPAVQAARADLERLRLVSSGLGDDTAAVIAGVSSQIDAVESQVARDPLGATANLAATVRAAITDLDHKLHEAQSRRARVLSDSEHAHRLLDELTAANEAARTAFERCTQEILCPTAAPANAPDPSSVAGLAGWLRTLEQTIDGGHWAAAGVGLGRWLAAGQELLATCKAAQDRSEGLLHRRDDLIGRLDARRQQAKTLAARGTIKAGDLTALSALEAEAAAALAKVPCPILEAEALVAAYEAKLHD